MKVINFAQASDDPSNGMDELCETVRYMLDNEVFGKFETEAVIASTLEKRNWLNSPERIEAVTSRLEDKTSFLSTLNRSIRFSANIPLERKEGHYKNYLNYEAAERIAYEPIEVGGKVITPDRLAMLKAERAKNVQELSRKKVLRSEAPENPFADKIANMIKARADAFPSIAPDEPEKLGDRGVSPPRPF